MGFTQSNLIPNGHAIEFRINAEDPLTFIPNPCKITQYAPAGGLGVRVDSAVYTGYTIPPTYDSMIAKLIVYAPNRAQCIMRAQRALDEFVIEGVKTTIPLQQKLLKNKDVKMLAFDNHWLETFLKEESEKPVVETTDEDVEELIEEEIDIMDEVEAPAPKQVTKAKPKPKTPAKKPVAKKKK